MAEITKTELEAALGGLNQLEKFGQAIQGARAVVAVLAGHMQAVSELEISKGKLGGEVKGLEDRVVVLKASKEALEGEIKVSKDSAASSHQAKMKEQGEELANQRSNAENELARIKSSTQLERARLTKEIEDLKKESGAWMVKRDSARTGFDNFLKEHGIQ